ncbi:hypothetical protein ACEWY4_025453 [Coilia grayii]|uniref:Uncharacterized protein n=1 Tax=Coilia grayii TaxID=363190 RepID=A0ABD1IXQ1_9TELE
MTGNRSKKTKLSSAPSFLDRAGGFYGRLDETEIEMSDGGKPKTEPEVTKGTGLIGEKSSGRMKPDHGVFHFNRGMIHDDGTTTLLRKKTTGTRWSRRSSRKVKADKYSTENDNQSSNTNSHTTPKCSTSSETQTEEVPVVQESEPPIVHFSIREEADDQALIRGQNCDTEVEEKKKVKSNQGQKNSNEQMKIAKRSTLTLYRKAIDRAFRRGWEAFVTSLYSVSLTTVTSTLASEKAEKSGGSVLIDYR